MKEEPIRCMVCSQPVAIVRLLRDDLDFNRDIEIQTYDALVCEECLRNKDILSNIDKYGMKQIVSYDYKD